MRASFTLLHRWAGLITAAFLFVSGITGALISWDHALDHLLNSHLTTAKTAGVSKPSTELARLIEERDARALVTYLAMAAEPGKSLSFFIEPKIDPSTGQRYTLDYNQVFIDGVTGDELGRRNWGAVWPLTRENFVSFLYRLHYTLHVPELWGSDRWGMRLLGVIAVIWTIDCFVGFYLTFPARKRAKPGRAKAVERGLQRGFWARWKPAWQVKWRGSPYRINFDIHRAFSLWTWVLLFVVAFTAFSLNLYNEVFSPLMKMVSDYTPSPYEERVPASLDLPIIPKLSFDQVTAIGSAESVKRGWSEPVGAIGYSSQYGTYSVRFYRPGEDHGTGGVGPAQLYYDGQDGKPLGARVPWAGTAADIFVQAQFPMHSGRILGLPGRILISVMGIIVAALSVTGVIIWNRKRRSRVLARTRAHQSQTNQSLAPAE